MNPRSFTRVVLLLALLPLLSSCKSSSLVGSAPDTSGGKVPPQGLRYYVGKDVLVVTVAVTETTKVELDENLDPNVEITTKREGTATLNTVADTTRPFVVDLEPGGRFDNSLVVDVRPNGLLKSINAQSTGKTGEAIVSLAKFAATVVGGIPVGLGGQSTTCDPAVPPNTRLPRRARATVASDQVACTLFGEITQLENQIEMFENERLQLERAAAGASAQTLTLNGRRIGAIEIAIENIRARLSQKQALFIARVDQFVQAKGLGTKEKTTSFTDMLDLAVLPPMGVISDAMDAAQTETALAAHALALAVFKRTGAVATIDTIPAWAGIAAHPATEKNRARIYFRQGQPLRLRLFVLSDCGGSGCLKTMSDQVVDVMHSAAGIQYVEFDESAFAQRKLLLAFDEKGRPEKLERSGTSELAAVASTLSSAATTLRDEYAATLTKVGEIQASQRTIELNDMTSELERLKKEKEVLDARLAVEGAAGNFANSLEQSRLASELAALQADIALKGVQATAEQSLEIAKLKSTTALLVEELNVIKAQLAVEQARR